MIRIVRSLLAGLMFVLVLAAAPAMAAPSSEQASSEQAVARAVIALHQALIARDEAALGQLTDVRLTYGHSTGATEDRATFIANVVAGKSPYVTIRFDDPKIVVRGKVAWVRGIMQAQMRNAKGTTDPIEFKILYVLLKDRTWKLLARQAVK